MLRFRQFRKVCKKFKFGEEFWRKNDKLYKMQEIFEEVVIPQSIVDELCLLGKKK